MLLGLYEDAADDGDGSFFEHIGLPPDATWGQFRQHYDDRGGSTPERVGRDLETYPPIAQRIRASLSWRTPLLAKSRISTAPIRQPESDEQRRWDVCFGLQSQADQNLTSWHLAECNRSAIMLHSPTSSACSRTHLAKQITSHCRDDAGPEAGSTS